MDFNVIADSLKDSFEVEIIHPKTGEGGWIFELASPCHAGAQAKVLDIMSKMRKRKITTSAQEEKDGNSLILARILGWNGLKSGDKAVPFTEEIAASILSNPKSYWVKHQLLEAMGDPSRPFAA